MLPVLIANIIISQIVHFLKQKSPFSNYLKEATPLKKHKRLIERERTVSPGVGHWAKPEASSTEILGLYSLKNTVPGFTNGPEVDRLPQISKNKHIRFLKNYQGR